MSEKENTLATKYDPKEVEDKWYKYWESHDLFKSVPDEREPYCIVIPPHIHLISDCDRDGVA